MNQKDRTEMEKKTFHAAETFNGRTEQLKEYLRRLGAGEALESVRADFVKQFSDVEASEIMQAEQKLLKEGTPLTEVQKLCDVHSALFHGATKEERIANAEKEVEASRKRIVNAEDGADASLKREKLQEELEKREKFEKKEYSDKHTKAAELIAIVGHPLYTFTKENEALAELLKQFKESRSEELLLKIRDLSVHYAKKGDLLYPQLKVKYGISGPSDVMWTVDDEIRDDLGILMKESPRSADWNTRLDGVLKRAEEMIYKEQNILFPLCAVNFTEDEWKGIYQDAKDYAVCFGAEPEVWDRAENVGRSEFGWRRSADGQQGSAGQKNAAGEIVMPGGHMTLEQLTALLNTVPLEISFIDTENINRFFKEGPKVFKRPAMAIDREVFSCHPPKIEPMVRAIIEDFRNNKRNRVPVCMEKGGRTMLVTYMAVRDKNGKYLGTAEFVQDMEFAKEHFGK